MQFRSSPIIQSSGHPSSIAEWFDSRRALRDGFLRAHNLSGAALHPVGEDCAFRRYFRLRDASRKSVILMEAVPDGQEIATPGHSLRDFIRIGGILAGSGLHTPEIYAVDQAGGYVLMEDFGDLSFKAALAAGHDAGTLYRMATDVLVFLHRSGVPVAGLPEYYKSHVHAARRRLVDWYLPACSGKRVADGVAEAYLAVWDGIEKGLPPCPQGFLHIDFHFENLMLLPETPPHPGPLPGGERGKIEHCGILDFQGAMKGPVPYDLANLLEDARVDVPVALRNAMLERFCSDMDAAEKEAFLNWYRVLATQFHCRVIGQFIRLAVRDGKERYLAHIPRVAGYIREGLKAPVLRPLAAWCAEQGMDFSKVTGLVSDKIGPLVREDAV